jgi:hypothetical protein
MCAKIGKRYVFCAPIAFHAVAQAYFKMNRSVLLDYPNPTVQRALYGHLLTVFDKMCENLLEIHRTRDSTLLERTRADFDRLVELGFKLAELVELDISLLADRTSRVGFCFPVVNLILAEESLARAALYRLESHSLAYAALELLVHRFA